MSKPERYTLTMFTNPSGQQVFRVQGRTAEGLRVRQNYRDRAEAVARKAELEIQALNQPCAVGLKRTRLTDDQLAQAEAAFLKLESGTLLDAVAHYAAHGGNQVSNTRLTQALDEYMNVKRTRKKLRSRTLQDYTCRLSALRTIHGGREVRSIVAADLEPLIFKPGQSAYTNNGNRRVLLGFFRWCKKQKYIVINPVEDIERAQQDDTEPAIMSLAEIKQMLTGAISYRGGKLLPRLVLEFFMGLRPEETVRLGWNHIQLQESTIRVTGEVAKLRSRRVIDIPPNAIEWLRLCEGKPLVPENWRRDFDTLRRLAGYKGSYPKAGDEHLKEWPNDVIRHTAISYHFAKGNDEHKTAYRSGNSPEVVHGCYKGLVARAEAEEFWSLRPNTKSENIIPLAMAS